VTREFVITSSLSLDTNSARSIPGLIQRFKYTEVFTTVTQY